MSFDAWWTLRARGLDLPAIERALTDVVREIPGATIDELGVVWLPAAFVEAQSDGEPADEPRFEPDSRGYPTELHFLALDSAATRGLVAEPAWQPEAQAPTAGGFFARATARPGEWFLGERGLWINHSLIEVDAVQAGTWANSLGVLDQESGLHLARDGSLQALGIALENGMDQAFIFASDDVWAVDVDGAPHRFEDAAWRSVPIQSGLGFYALERTSEGYVGRAGDTLHLRQGATWTELPLPASRFIDLHAVSPRGELWATNGSAVYARRSGAWTPMAVPLDASALALLPVADDEVWWVFDDRAAKCAAIALWDGTAVTRRSVTHASSDFNFADTDGHGRVRVGFSSGVVEVRERGAWSMHLGSKRRANRAAWNAIGEVCGRLAVRLRGTENP